MSNVLDLSGADLTEFEALPSGQYNATIYEMEPVETAGGPDAKLPAGTPGFKIRFAIQDEPHVGRAVYSNYYIPPAEYDAQKAAKMKGAFARFLIAIGYHEKDVLSGKLKIDDLSDVGGRECVVIIGPPNLEGSTFNSVKGVKPAGSKGGSSSGGLI